MGLAKSLDGAPVKARENRMKRLPRLFDGMHIYLQGDFNNPYPQKKQLTEILTKGVLFFQFSMNSNYYKRTNEI